MSAPERIWADYDHWIDYAPTRSDRLRGSGEYTEYVRADLLTAAQAEIERLTAERDEWKNAYVSCAQDTMHLTHRAEKAEAERDAAMAGPIREITEADMKNIVAHLSYECDPQGPLPSRNSLMMEVVHLSNRLAAIQPAPPPQAREITVQEAALGLLCHLPSEHICWAAMQDGIDDGLDVGDIMRTALRAQIDRERAATIEAAVQRIEPGDNAEDIPKAVLMVAQASIRALHTDATRAAMDAIRQDGYEAGVRAERAKLADLANAARDLADCCQLGDDADWAEGEDPLSVLRERLAASIPPDPDTNAG